ncbi:Phosphoinositide phosphatase family protein [Perilla frutescens var. hirtella]|nr:Phosphoinositide phosphatase family protein [Perilla frutescens var. hirtella]
MFGLEKRKRYGKVLKISRLEQSELSIVEDSTIYTLEEHTELLERIDNGNKYSGGLKFVTICYGIVGFIKFLGPYYMILITKRRKIGTVCGHAVYSIVKSEMIPIPHPSVHSNMAYSKNENRARSGSGSHSTGCRNQPCREVIQISNSNSEDNMEFPRALYVSSDSTSNAHHQSSESRCESGVVNQSNYSLGCPTTCGFHNPSASSDSF